MPLSDLLLYLLIVGAVVLFNHFTQQAARRKREQEEAAQARARAAAAAGDEAGPHAWGRVPVPPVATSSQEATPYEWGRHPAARTGGLFDEGSVPVPPLPLEAAYARVEQRPPAAVLEARSSVLAPQARRDRRPGAEARRLFATRQDLHRAVVAMTVLGPCRAIDPPDLHDASEPLRPAR